MASPPTPNLRSELFRNLWQNGEDDEVIKLCNKTADGPFQKCTIYNNTVLHTALYMKRYRLAHRLLDDHLRDSLVSKLHDQNEWGDTLLHNAATSDKGLDKAGSSFSEKLLRYAPELLRVRNKWGETAVFQACRYGKLQAFKLLANEVNKFRRMQPQPDEYLHFFKRDDGITILHMAILTRNFDMALLIAREHPNLRNMKGSKNEMTPLQMLACSPTAFKSGAERGSFFKELVYSSVDPGIEEEEEDDDDDDDGGGGHKGGGVIQKVVSIILAMRWKPRCILPMLEAVKKVKRDHKRAEQLAKILIESDTTWKEGPKPNSEYTPQIGGANNESLLFEDDNKAEDDLELGTKRPSGSSSSSSSSGSIPDAKEIPLILAAKHGCVEIVKEILDQFPEAMEYLNYERQTFLHVAIKNRNLEVFKLIDPKTSPIRGQLRAIDVKGNSILHMVGLSSTKSIEDYKMKSPVIRLSDDLQLLEYLKSLCPSCLINHHNCNMKTAGQLFAANNEQLRSDAKEWLKRTAEHCTVVIVLIATVAFASAYTVPGGPNSQTGYPLLLSKPLFLVFTVADVLSLGFALTAVVIFLSILTSSFEMKEFRRSLPEKLLLGFTLLFLSVSMMMVAFAATIILMINNKERWTKIGVYVVAFFPVCIFMLSYIPLYVKLVESLRRWALKIGKSLPRVTCASS